MKQYNNIPQLRFPEFVGEWEEYRIKEKTSKIGSGKTPKGGEDVYVDEGIPFVRSQNVMNNSLILDGVCIPQAIHESMIGSSVKPRDILLNITGGSIGRSCVVPDDFKEGNVNQHVCIIRLKKDNPFFLHSLLSSWRGQKLVFQAQTGSGREGLNFESISKFKIKFPNLPEQQKIASFLTAVDKRIQLLIRKKEQLELYKKSVMQKIFSREIRFKDENGKDFPEWEEKKLGEVCEKKSSNISANSLLGNSGNYKIYGATGYLQSVNFYKEKKAYISIVKDGAGVGRVLICEPESSVLGTLDIIRSNQKSDLRFIYYFLSRLNFSKYAIGSTIPHIYFKDYSKEKIKLPILVEQQKIAQFLTTLGKKIEHTTGEIEKMKEWKRGLLQKMFV